MKNATYNIVILANFQLESLKTNTKNATFFFVGKNLSKDKFERDLKTLSSHEDHEYLKKLLKENNVVSVGLMKNETYPILQKELDIIQQKIDLKQSHFVVLVDYKDPNIYQEQQNLPPEEFFMISRNDFFLFYEKRISTSICYDFMLKAMKSNGHLAQIITHQLGHPSVQICKNFGGTKSTEVIMPHRGDTNDLETALWYLNNQKMKSRKISVCFDEPVTKLHFDLADKNQSTQFFVNYPSGVGPYPSRDILARTTKERVIIFHDSDDISTFDRTSVLVNFLNKKNIDAVGSHELRINKIEKKIVAVRYPLNVIQKTYDGQYAIFFPATAIKKSAYLKTGGLSTIRKHSLDSQFYKRSYFFLNIENVDEFLYIRVKHENSLTTASATALGSPIRERLKLQWGTDFSKVQHRNISLTESTLVDEYNNVAVEIIPLSEKYRKVILDWQQLNSLLQKQSLSNQIEKKVLPDEKDILEERLLDFKLIKDPSVHVLKQSLSWRIGWRITRTIIYLFGWIPFIKKRM